MVACLGGDKSKNNQHHQSFVFTHLDILYEHSTTDTCQSTPLMLINAYFKSLTVQVSQYL